MRPTSQANLSDVKIYYSTSHIGINIQKHQYLKVGENHLHNDQFNKTEKVILEKENYENEWYARGFRIIHVTPILNKNHPTIDIQIEYNVKNNASSSITFDSDLVFFYITSRQNSPGMTFYKWKDGKQLQITMSKNYFVVYNIQPQITKVALIYFNTLRK